MNARTQKRLAAQIRAMERQEGAELYATAAAACCALLRECALDIASLNEGELQTLLGHFTRLSRQAEAFFAAASTCLGGAAQARGEQLASARQRAEEAAAARESAERDCLRQEAALQGERERLADAQARLTALETQRSAALNALGTTHSPARLQAEEREAEELQARLAKSDARLKELRAQSEGLRQRLEALEGEIEKCPEEARALVARAEEQEALLCRLHQAAECYTPEKQAALKEEIERLSAETEENQRACRLLSDRLEGLRAADGESGETRERLACELLLRVQAALQGTEQALSEQEQTLAEARGQAEALEARFAACETERQRLSDWLEAEETPLQAMMRALEHPEAEQLRQTLDIGSVERVRALLEETRARLQELDEVLRRCAAAARLDRDALNRRARR